MSASTIYATVAGIFGAFGALSAKIIYGTFLGNVKITALALVAFIISNILMWRMFTKSLSTAETTLQPLMFNMGANFIITGIFGTFFNEKHSWLWWFGLLCVTIGLYFLVSIETKIKRK